MYALIKLPQIVMTKKHPFINYESKIKYFLQFSVILENDYLFNLTKYFSAKMFSK